jgi:aminoglycoside 3'-phosphotransferase II
MYLPPMVSSLVGDGHLEQVDIECTQASVFRIARTGQPTIFLKSALLTEGADLSNEAERLRWLQPRLAVPRVLVALVHEGREYLVTTALAGLNGVAIGRKDPAAVVSGLANALASWHAQSTQGCPFNEMLKLRLATAYVRLKDGRVDKTAFDEEHRGRNPIPIRIWRWQPGASLTTSGRSGSSHSSRPMV